jgi:glucokinase
VTVIGVDVGGTKVAAAVVDRGQPGEIATVPTDTSSRDALLEQLVSVVDGLRDDTVTAVGLGVPSIVDSRTGRIRYSVNVPLIDLPLRDLLTDRIGLPVFVENDANCAALAEAYDGEELVATDLVMFTVGTGVGGGLVLGGKLYRGATGATAEMGHQLIGADLRDELPEAGKFPQTGSLESFAAGGALEHLAERLARELPESRLGQILAENGRVTGRDAVAAAREGDAAGRRALRLLGQRLGVGIANAINVFDPAEVVIGGGVSAAGDLLLGPAREVAAQYTLTGVGTETTIRLARRGNEAGVVGAALVASLES